MEGIAKQKFYAGNATQFRQGNQLVEVHELEDLQVIKQKEEILTSGFRSCPSYNDIDNTDSPFRRLIGLDKDPPDNKSFFSSCDIIDENKIRAEENQGSRLLFQPISEKKKNKSMRKKDTGKNSQIIDPSREPNYIGNLPLEEIMKNFESKQATRKTKKLSKKKSVTIHKNKDETNNIEEEEIDVLIVNENENIPKVTENLITDFVKDDLIESYENGFETFNFFSNETNNNNESLSKFITYKKSEIVNNEKPKNNNQKKNVEKKTKKPPKLVHEVLQENKVLNEENSATYETVLTIKNPFFGKSAERLKEMTDLERKLLWATPIDFTELTHNNDDKCNKVNESKHQTDSIITTLNNLISKRKFLLKQSQNALLIDDLEFLANFKKIIHAKDVNQKKIKENRSNNSAFEKPRSNNQSQKKSSCKISALTYPHRGG